MGSPQSIDGRPWGSGAVVSTTTISSGGPVPVGLPAVRVPVHVVSLAVVPGPVLLAWTAADSGHAGAAAGRSGAALGGVGAGRMDRAVEQGDPGSGTQERLAFDRIGGRFCGDLFGEQLLSSGQQPGVHTQAGLRVEPAVEAPHPVGIDPGPQPGGVPLPFQAGRAAVGFQGPHLGVQLAAQLHRGQHLGAPHQPTAVGDQHGAHVGFDLAQHRADHIDMAA